MIYSRKCLVEQVLDEVLSYKDKFNNISLSSPSLSWGLRCSEEFSSLDILGEILELVVEICCLVIFMNVLVNIF